MKPENRGQIKRAWHKKPAFGSLYTREGSNIIHMSIYYFKERVRFTTHLENTMENWVKLTDFLEEVGRNIRRGTFSFAKTFYWLDDAVKDRFSRLEDNNYIEPKHVLFGDVAEAYSLNEIPRFSVTKQRRYRSALKTQILPYFENFPLTRITAMEINIFIFKMWRHVHHTGPFTTKPLSFKTASTCIAVMRAVWKFARRYHSWIRHDPFPVSTPRSLRRRTMT